MEINFTKKQYQKLMELVYLGEWVANAARNDEIEEYNQLQQYISSFAKDFGQENLVEFDKELNKYVPTKKLEGNMQHLTDYYNQETFWEQLSSYMAKRDLMKEAKDDKSLSHENQIKRLFEIEEKYEEEFYEYGIERLEVKK